MKAIASKDVKPAFIRHYLSQHYSACLTSFNNLARHPGSTLLIIIMISIALVLPTALFVFLENAKSVSAAWSDTAQISLYLRTDVNDSQVKDLMQHLQEQPDVAKTTYISPAQGLADFQQQTGLNDTLTVLKQNPIPGVILLEPKENASSYDAMNSLLQNVKTLPEVDNAVLDLQWVKRLAAILDLGKKIVFVLGCLLALGILFIIGNAIHLSLQRYHNEISVLQLIGAGVSYIRRPFLYVGFWYGLLGAILALLIINLLLMWLKAPVQHLAVLYDSSFRLQGMQWHTTLDVLMSGAFLGLLGAGLAVNKIM